MATERDRSKDYNAAYDQAVAGFGSWQHRVKLDYKVYLDAPWTESELRRFKLEGREAMSFPQIRRIVKWVTGWQRENMRSIRYDPVEDADMQTADQQTEVLTWVMQHANGYNVLSEAFEGCLKTAMNLVNVYSDRNSDIMLDRFGYNQFLLDPTFSRRDLARCSYGMMRKYISKDEAKMLLPGKESFIDEQMGDRDEKFPFYNRPTLFGEKLLAYDEFQQKKAVKRKIVLIKPLNREIVWEGSDAGLKALLQRLMIENPGIRPEMFSTFPRWEKTVEVTSFLENEEMNHGIDLFEIGDFSFTPKIAYYDPDFDNMELKLQSLVTGLVDSQRAHDKRMMSMIAMFEQQISTGVDFEEGSFVDEEDAWATGTKPRLVRENKIDAIRDRKVPDIPQGMFQLLQLFGESMPKSVGVNEEMTGFAEGGNPQIAGVLAKMRQRGGLTGLSDLYHNNAYSDKVIGSKLLKLIQALPLERIRRILNEEPSQQFRDRNFGKYDSSTVEGIMTDTQKNVAYMDLLNLSELALKFKQPLPWKFTTLVKNAPIHGKPDVLKEIAENEAQQAKAAAETKQKQDEMHQLEMEGKRGEIMAARGFAEAQRAKSMEDVSDAVLNRVETAEKIQGLAQSRAVELLQMAIDMETVAQQNAEIKVKS